MNDEKPSQADALAQLIRAAGRREDPPAQAYQRTLEVATAAWQAKIRRRQRVVGAIAASLVVATVSAWFALTRQPVPPQPIAQVERIIGTVDMRTATDPWTTLRDESQTVVAGTRLRTHDGSRIGIIIAGTVSLRLADRTELAIDSASRIHLISGKAYIDTGGNGKHRLELITDTAVATNVGTQFEVRYLDGSYRLRVREGEVRLRSGATDLRSLAGEQLSISVNGEVSRKPVASDDADWLWALALAPAPDIDNQPLTVLLNWVTRETGRVVKFANAEAQRRAASTILHGNIRHLAPLEALSVMLATTDLEYVLLDDGTIMIQ